MYVVGHISDNPTLKAGGPFSPTQKLCLSMLMLILMRCL